MYVSQTLNLLHKISLCLCSSVGHLVILANHNSIIQKVVRWWLQISRLSPNIHSLSTPKIFICYMMHESTLSSHTTLHDPWPYLHRCNMTQMPPSIFACGVDSMNFYYAACVCHLVWLFLLILLNTSESWKYFTWRSKMNSHCKTDL